MKKSNVKIFSELVEKARILFATIGTEFTDSDFENIELSPNWADFSDMAEKGDMLGRLITKKSDGTMYITCDWSKGAIMKRHKHPNYHESLLVVSGKLRDKVSGMTFEVGDSYKTIQANQKHYIQAIERTIFVIRLTRIKSDDERY